MNGRRNCEQAGGDDRDGGGWPKRRITTDGIRGSLRRDGTWLGRSIGDGTVLRRVGRSRVREGGWVVTVLGLRKVQLVDKARTEGRDTGLIEDQRRGR